MIVFDLRCANGHVFEAWLASTAAYEDQRARGLLSCPLCDNVDIGKAVMAPNIVAKGDRAKAPARACDTSAEPSPAAFKAAMQALAKAQAQLLEKSQWVGRSFAEKARAMHAGETESASIHGQTTPAEARALAEDGVPCAPLPFPVVPPEALN